MKIIIVRTNGVDEVLFKETIEFLKGFSGVKIDSHTQAITLKKKEPGLIFEDFFSKCDAIRDLCENPKIEEKDFVVLLTDVPNEGRYFSFFQKSEYRRNAFINTEDWEYFTGSLQVHYALAYQIVENCLQSLINLDEEEGHLIPRGCVNDFCYQKEEVILKMQTANICPDCRKKVNAYPEALAFQKYALSVMNSVRSELVLETKEVSVEEKKVEMINPDDCRLIINTTKLHFSVYWKSIEIANYSMPELSFVFYLTFLEGFALKGLSWVDLNNPEIKKFMIDKASQNRAKRGIQSLIDERAYLLERNSLVNRAIKGGFLETYKNQTEIQNHLQIGSSKQPNSNTVYSIAFSRKNISFSAN